MDIMTLTSAAAKSMASAVTKLSSVLRVRIQKKHLATLQRSLKDAINSVLTPEVVEDANPNFTQIAAYLGSPHFSDVCYQVLMVQAAGLTVTYETDLRTLLEYELRLYTDDTAARRWATYIGASLTQAAQAILTNDTLRALLSDSRIQAEAHQRYVEQLLSGIAHRLEIIDRVTKTSTNAEIEAFEKKYRSQLQTRYRKITPPNLGTPRSVPFSKVYVPAALASGDEDIKLGDFISAIHRTIVVGDPGGGKTTLATRIILDATSAAGLYGRKDVLTPFVVTLREYAARRQEKPMSIVQYIEETLAAKFEISDAPDNVVAFMFVTGRAIAIFDGLDELLDTTQRQEIVQNVELFCALYSTAPALVTSRAVGYAEAPLDQEVFDLFKLAKFNTEQVEEYVRKWFANAPDLPTDERATIPAQFLLESELAGDLTTNPLMLSLMCNLYRGERYIPRNRPELYEKCATMLFERWDRNRRIVVSLPIESHVRPAMMAIAYKIFETPRLQEGVPRSELESMAVAYLLGAKYDSEEKARRVAVKFIDFCTGRAWVFTNTGSSDREELYQFTHRTFLEYFAAAHLASTCHETLELLNILLPHVALAEWDVVSQLAVQILSKQVGGAADDMIDGILQFEAALPSSQKCNVLSFGVRCLGFLVPREATVRRLIGRMFEVVIDQEVYAERSPARSLVADSFSPIDLISNIFHVTDENHEPALEALATGLSDALGASSPIALDLCCARIAASVRQRANRLPFDAGWSASLEGLFASAGERLALSRDQMLLSKRSCAVYAFERRMITSSQFVSFQGVEHCFLPIWDTARREYLAPEAYRFLEWDRGNEVWLSWASSAIATLRGSPPPWFACGALIDPFSHPLERRLMADVARRDGVTLDAPSSLMEVVLLAAAFEALVSARDLSDRAELEGEVHGREWRRDGMLVYWRGEEGEEEESREFRRFSRPTSNWLGRRRTAALAFTALRRKVTAVRKLGGVSLGILDPVERCVERLVP